MGREDEKFGGENKLKERAQARGLRRSSEREKYQRRRGKKEFPSGNSINRKTERGRASVKRNIEEFETEKQRRNTDELICFHFSSTSLHDRMVPEVLRNEPSNEKCDIYNFYGSSLHYSNLGEERIQRSLLVLWVSNIAILTFQMLWTFVL